jgi:hypothetical protein
MSWAVACKNPIWTLIAPAVQTFGWGCTVANTGDFLDGLLINWRFLGGFTDHLACLQYVDDPYLCHFPEYHVQITSRKGLKYLQMLYTELC